MPHCPRRHFLNVVRLKAAPWKFSTLKVVSRPNNQPAIQPTNQPTIQRRTTAAAAAFFLFLILLPFGMTKICAVYLSSLQVVLTCFRCIICVTMGMYICSVVRSLAMCISGGWRWTKVGVHMCADAPKECIIVHFCLPAWLEMLFKISHLIFFFFPSSSSCVLIYIF